MGVGGYGGGPFPQPFLPLPNTGGNTFLTFVSIAAITVGTIIILSTVARIVAKKVL